MSTYVKLIFAQPMSLECFEECILVDNEIRTVRYKQLTPVLYIDFPVWPCHTTLALKGYLHSTSLHGNKFGIREHPIEMSKYFYALPQPYLLLTTYISLEQHVAIICFLPSRKILPSYCGTLP